MSRVSTPMLRLRHESIKIALLDLQALRNDYRSVRYKIGECREIIYSYLAEQDESFYQSLADFYQENRSAFKIIGFLAQDIKDLKIESWGFFEKYRPENPLEHGKNFVKDLRVYTQVIMDRFGVEEDQLMALLNRIGPKVQG